MTGIHFFSPISSPFFIFSFPHFPLPTLTFSSRCSKVQTNVKLDLDRSLPYYRIDKVFTNDWDTLHRKFNCCGSNSFQDFNTTHNDEIPPSCYTLLPNSTTTDPQCFSNCSPSELKETGCKVPISDFIRNKSAGLGTVFVFQSIVWLTLSMISGCMACSIKLRLQLEEKARRLTCAPVANHLHAAQGRRF